MSTLRVLIEREGTLIPAGRILGSDPAEAVFVYDPEYIDEPGATPISISLPLGREPFLPLQTRAFFEGLLPEGFTRRSVAQHMQVDEQDYISILHGLGRECLGAICVAGDDEIIPEASYEPLTERQVRELAAEGVSRSTEIITKTHLSLTGASGKVGLYLDEDSGDWFLPQGTAASTHIIKQSHIRMRDIVTNELLSMRTAARCGIRVPESFILDTGGGSEEEILFATRRYDRIFPEKATAEKSDPAEKLTDSGRHETSGQSAATDMMSPRRLHQEDFAQAMGIPAADKYEKKDGSHLSDMIRLLTTTSVDPIGDIGQLWDRVVFNCLIGNTDAHIKNFSIIYDADLHGRRLAPAYDIISTTVYDSSTREMAFRIGDQRNIDSLTEDSFRLAAREAGIGGDFAITRFEELRDSFRPAILESAVSLADMGYVKAMDIAKEIINNSPIKV